VRFDQMTRLGARLRARVVDPGHVSNAELVTVLAEFGKELMSADWRDLSKAAAAMDLTVVLQRFRELCDEQRIDHGRRRVVETAVAGAPPDGAKLLREPHNTQPGYWEVDVPEPNLQTWATVHGLILDSDGRLHQE
jgi:hypothetical protein